MIESCQKRMLPELSVFILNGQPVASIMFKLLVGRAEAQTKATTSNLREQLSTIAETIVNFSYAIDEFHEFVREIMYDLEGYGENNFPDLTIHLFDSYIVVPVTPFRDMMLKKRDEYQLDNKDLDPEDLVTHADTLFNARKNKIAFKWLQKSEEQEKIESLSAEVKEFKKQANRPNKKLEKAGGEPGKMKRGKKGEDEKKTKLAWKEVLVPKETSLTRRKWMKKRTTGAQSMELGASTSQMSVFSKTHCPKPSSLLEANAAQA